MTAPPAVGHSEHDEHHFRGHRVFAELAGREGFWSFVSLAVGARLLGPDESGVLDTLCACVMASDPRIPPLKLTRLCAAYGHDLSAFGATYVALDGARLGPSPTQPAAELLSRVRGRLKACPPTLEELRRALEPELEHTIGTVPGFGVPARSVDERVTAMRSLLRAHKRDHLPHWGILMAAQDLLGTPANVAGGVAAVLLDLGYTPAQAPLLAACLVLPAVLAHATEGAQQRPEVLLRLPAEWVRYRGKAPRQSPRALRARRP